MEGGGILWRVKIQERGGGNKNPTFGGRLRWGWRETSWIGCVPFWILAGHVMKAHFSLCRGRGEVQ